MHEKISGVRLNQERVEQAVSGLHLQKQMTTNSPLAEGLRGAPAFGAQRNIKSAVHMT